jgi:hypothetical protein
MFVLERPTNVKPELKSAKQRPNFRSTSFPQYWVLGSNGAEKWHREMLREKIGAQCRCTTGSKLPEHPQLVAAQLEQM